MEVKTVFMILAGFSVLLFSFIAIKRTYIAQLLSPGLPEPFFEKREDMEMWLRPY
jgi:hypothetical protein